MSGNTDLTQLTDAQLNQAIQQTQSNVNQQADTNNTLSQLSDAQLDGLIASHTNAAVATGTDKPADTSTGLDHPLVAAGAGFVDVGNQGKVLAAQLFGSDQDVKDVRKSNESEAAQYANTSVGSSLSGKIIKVGTEVGTYALAGAAASAFAPEVLGVYGTNAAIGFAIGAYQDPGEDGSRIINGLESAATGFAIQGGLNKLGSAFAGVSRGLDANPGAVTVGQATGNKTLLGVDKELSDLGWFMGTKANLTNQVNDTKNAVETMFADAKAQPQETLGADLANSMARVNAKVSDFNDAQYAKVIPQIDQAASNTPIKMTPVNNAVAKSISQIAQIPGVQSQTVNGVTKLVSSDPAVQTVLNTINTVTDTGTPALFSDLVTLQRTVGTQYGQLSQSNPQVASILKPIANSLESVTQSVANSTEYGTDFANLSKFYKDRVLPFRSIKLLQKGVAAGKANAQNAADLAQGVTGQVSGAPDGINPTTADNVAAIAPSSIVNQFLKSTPPEQLRPLVASLDQDGKNALKNGILHTMLVNNTASSGANAGEVNLIKLGSDLRKNFSNVGLVMDKTSQDQMQGVVNMLSAIKNNPLVFAKDGNLTSNPLIKYGAAITAAHHFGGPAGVPVLAALTSAITRLTSTKGGLKSIAGIGKMGINHSELAGRTRDILTRFGQLEAAKTSLPSSATPPVPTGPLTPTTQPSTSSEGQQNMIPAVDETDPYDSSYSAGGDGTNQ